MQIDDPGVGGKIGLGPLAAQVFEHVVGLARLRQVHSARQVVDGEEIGLDGWRRV